MSGVILTLAGHDRLQLKLHHLLHHLNKVQDFPQVQIPLQICPTPKLKLCQLKRTGSQESWRYKCTQPSGKIVRLIKQTKFPIVMG